MNTELLKKPLHAKSWSSLTRLFILTSLVQGSTLVIAVAPPQHCCTKQPYAFLRQHPFVMRKRFADVLLIESTKRIHDVVPRN